MSVDERRDSSITASNYNTKAVEFVAKDSSSVESIEPGTRQWDEWKAYFERLGHSFNLSLMRQHKKFGVPTIWPWQFDSTYQEKELEA